MTRIATPHCATLLIAAAATVAATAGMLLLTDGAGAKEIRLERTAKSGVETRVAFSSLWDRRTCASLPNVVTISKQPANGTARIVPGVQTLPRSTPGSGSTECEGKQIDSSQVMYRSKQGFKGIDVMGYHTGAGIDATITIKVE